MKCLHYINAALWAVNAILWTFYAGSTFMGLASLAAAATAAYIGWNTDTWG